MPARARRAGVRALRTLYSTSTGVNRFSGLQPFVIPCIEPGVFPFLSCKVPGRASRAVDDRLCCKVRAMISVPPVWFWIVSYEKYSIRVGISLCTVVKARQSRVTGPRSWSPRGAHPVPREGVVIIAATRGQHYLGDNGLGHGPDPSGPTVALRGQVRAPRQSMRSRGTEGHRLARHHLVVYTWMDPYGVRGSH